MSVTGVGGNTTPVDTTPVAPTTTTTTTTTSHTLGHAAFASSPVFADVLAGRKTVGMGERGAHVKVLEEALVKAMGKPLPYGAVPNNSLTAATRKALTDFQNENRLTPSGVLDKDTLIALDKKLTGAGGTGGTGGTGGVTPPAGPLPTDRIPKNVLEKYGLSTTSMTTESKYEGQEWGSVGYFPYSGLVQYASVAKMANVFGGEAAEDAHSYFEFYSNPPGGLNAGSHILSGHISESNFEMTAGVDVGADRTIGNASYKLLREAGAPNDAKMALRTADGKDIPVKAGDKLVPTILKDGKPVEVDMSATGSYTAKGTGAYVGSSDVTWRLKRDGAVLNDASHKAEDKKALLGLTSSVKFDFLDASGELVGFNPPADRIAETWQDGTKWHVLAKKADGKFEHQVIDGSRIASTETLEAAAATSLKAGKDVMLRVQTISTGALKGDGKVGGDFNMGWWGKCHNVASLSTTNMPKPEKPVSVITNLAAGDKAAVKWEEAGKLNVLVPKNGADGAISGYTQQVRNADGTVASTKELTLDEGKRLTDGKATQAVLVKADGKLKDAEVTKFDTKALEALVAHIGDGAVKYVGGNGQRYYASPDIIVKKDGTQVQAHIKELKTAGGKTHTVGTRNGAEFDDQDRSELRSPSMTSRTLNNGGRSMAFNVQDMAKLNQHRGDDIKELVVVHPDGREETIKASDVNIFGWENKHDFSPDMLWDLHKTIGKDASTVIETAQGTQVWNYSATSIKTDMLDPSKLSAEEKENAKKPGMMIGSTDDAGKVFFRTQIETDGGSKDITYWVKLDNAGKVKDYSYLSDDADTPDFVWTQHVKKGEKWTGESQAPGVNNADIQRLYFASRGRLDTHTLPGGFITTADLKNAREKPE